MKGSFEGSRGGRVYVQDRDELGDRATPLSGTQLDSVLARRPYDLRHARLTWWLNAGVPPTQVAKWAGHSVRVLLDVYAGCVDGGEKQALSLLSRD